MGMNVQLFTLDKLPSEISWVATPERAFLAMAPKLWNALPRESHLSPSTVIFCQQVMTFLFSLAFPQ